MDFGPPLAGAGRFPRIMTRTGTDGDEWMLVFRACPKCVTGALEVTSGLDGHEVRCLNCSLTAHLENLQVASPEGALALLSNKAEAVARNSSAKKRSHAAA